MGSRGQERIQEERSEKWWGAESRTEAQGRHCRLGGWFRERKEAEEERGTGGENGGQKEGFREVKGAEGG